MTAQPLVAKTSICRLCYLAGGKGITELYVEE